MFDVTKSVTVACLAFMATFPIHAGENKHGFVNKVHKDGSKYVLFIPHEYTDDKEYPVILFLHGSGERGDDGQLPVQQGIGNAIKFKGKEKAFPFFVIFPQATKGGNWSAGEADAERALAILDETLKTYKLDANRVYLTGLSMGGSGTWSLAAAYPDRWAAIVPICGRADLDTAEKMKDIPCWSFCGDKDRDITVENMRSMFQSMKKAGGQPRYSEYPYVGHNSWDSAYVTPELYSWLLAQKRK